MRHIDKNKPEYKAYAHRLLNTFIQGQWQEDVGRYINLTYESFRNDAFRDLLLKEQSHYCCYCMKHILGKDTTLEHIIPNKSNESTVMDEYIAYGEIAKNVFFWKKESDSRSLQPPPFPHILAYENLVASCNGDIPDGGLHQSCNNIRKQKKIIPVFYI
jgi:5-methylcytosine-specific restriction endonuclease McrA